MVKNGTPIEALLDLNELGIGGYAPQSLESAFKPQHVNPSLQEQMMKENEDRAESSKPIMSSRIRQTSNMRRAMNAGIDPKVYEMGMNVNVMDDDVYELGPKARNIQQQNIHRHDPRHYYPQHNSVPSNTAHLNYVIEGYDNPPKLTCLDVANHIQNCPICSKFYENDKSMYIVIIIILLIMCIILVKKLIDCYNKH